MNNSTSLSSPEGNLAKALKARFPGERVECLAELLSQALERGYITYLGIGDRKATDKLKLFQGLKARAESGRMTPHTFYQSAAEVGSHVDINQAIAEFKGAGMISPCLHRSVFSGVIEYEINLSL